MWPYVIAGLVMGGIYAITSAGLVVTYQSAGVLNFAFGALAFFIARLFYFLNTQHGWSVPLAAIVSIVLVGPALGVVLYFCLFRFLRLSPPLIKIIATFGLSVMVSPISALLFGDQNILNAPGLAPQPVRVFHVLGVPVTMDQLIVYGCVLAVVIVGALVLRYSDAGLRVRAMVDSPAMTSLSGTNPTAVSVGVWAASVGLAGLAGVLSAPIIGLDPSSYTLLMAAAFAAVIAARLRNLPLAVVVALLMGVAGSLLQHYLPPDSSFTAAAIPSIPFVVAALFLVYHLIRRRGVDEAEGVGGALDRAIAVQSGARSGPAGGSALGVAGVRGQGRAGWIMPVLGVVVVAILPLVMQGFWVGLLAVGVSYGIIFLSYTLVVGEGGMVWLAMATFAGVGGLTAGQLATVHHWPALAAILGGGIVATPLGVIMGLLTIRLGNLYVALVTFTFGLLMDNLVFTRDVFVQSGLGVDLDLPSFADTNQRFTYFALIVFVLISLFVVNLRRSTTGMALSAVRSTEAASKTIGISVLQMKVILAALATFVAGVGGAMLAISLQVALPTNYATLVGVVWLAVLVTQGIRSTIAALVAGLALTLLPGVMQAYAPASFGQLPPILFGLGAVFIVTNPDGAFATQARQLQGLMSRLRQRRPVGPASSALGSAQLSERTHR